MFRAPWRSIVLHPRGDALSEILVDMTPIFEGSREYRLRDPVLEVTDDIAHQACTRRIELGRCE